MPTITNALAEAAQREPDLAPYYDLHQTLIGLQEQAKQEISATLEMADEEALQERIVQGLPLIAFDQLPIEANSFAKLAAEIAKVLVEYNVETEESKLPDTAAEWLALARQQFEAGQATAEQKEESETTLAHKATDVALKPYLEWASEQVLPHVDQEHWKLNYCPVCGGAPDLATLGEEAGARHLLCSRCDSQWTYRRVGCPFCGTTEHTKLSYYPSEDELYRLYVCQECQRYLKTVDLRKATRIVSLPVERIITVAMDAAAQQEGYQ